MSEEEQNKATELEAQFDLERKRHARRIRGLEAEIQRLKGAQGIDLDETAAFLIDSAESRLRAAQILLKERYGELPPEHL